MTEKKKVRLDLTAEEVKFIISMLEGQKIKVMFEDPEADTTDSDLTYDYQMTERLSSKLLQYVSGN